MVWTKSGSATGYNLHYANYFIGTAAERLEHANGEFTQADECSGVTIASGNSGRCIYAGAAFGILATSDMVKAGTFNGSRYWKIQASYADSEGTPNKLMGPLSDAVLMWRADAPDAPGKPQRNTNTSGAVIYGTDKSIQIKWAAPTKLNGIAGALTDNADFGINNYKIFFGSTSDKATTAASTYPKNPDATTKVLPAVFTHDVSGLTRGTYYYAVKASTIAGDSVYSATSDAITSASAPTAPTAVIPFTGFVQTADNLKI